MSANRKRKLNITKKNTYDFPPYITKFIASHTTPLQLFFHTYLLLQISSNQNIIYQLVIITYLFFIIHLLINSTHLIITYLFIIINLFINNPHLLLVRFSLLIVYTKHPFILLLITQDKRWILATHIFLKGNTTNQAHLCPIHFLLTPNCWFSLWDISPWRIKG